MTESILSILFFGSIIAELSRERDGWESRHAGRTAGV